MTLPSSVQELPGTGYTVAGVLAALILVSAGVAGALQEGSLFGPDHDYSDRPKVALIVFDGGDWTPINRLRKRGELPAIDRAMEEGVYSDFKTPMAFSPISWTKIGTGLSRDKIGIEGWNEKTGHGLRMIQRQDVENRRIWDYLNEANISTGVSGYLVTWPVDEIKGYMISGPLATSNKDLVYSGGYLENVSAFRQGTDWEHARMAISQTKDDVPFMVLGFKRPDQVQHLLWKFIEPSAFGMEKKPEHRKFREVVYTEYRRLDDVISRYGENWNVIVVSDSGFKPERSEFNNPATSYEANPQPILRELGYVNYSTRTVFGESVKRIGPGSKLKNCAILYPNAQIISRNTYRFRLCILDKSLDVKQAMEDLRSISYADGTQLVTKVRYKNYSESGLKDSIVGRMKILPEKNSTKTVVRKKRLSKPSFTGTTTFIDKGLLLEMPDGEEFRWWIGPEKSGDHPRGTSGIFIARGPAIRDGGELNASISAVDIAPTILYMYGLPVPRNMDGEPVTEMFTEGFRDSRELKYTSASTLKTEEDYLQDSNSTGEKALRERLKDLGYLRTRKQ